MITVLCILGYLLCGFATLWVIARNTDSSDIPVSTIVMWPIVFVVVPVGWLADLVVRNAKTARERAMAKGSKK